MLKKPLLAVFALAVLFTPVSSRAAVSVTEIKKSCSLIEGCECIHRQFSDDCTVPDYYCRYVGE